MASYIFSSNDTILKLIDEIQRLSSSNKFYFKTADCSGCVSNQIHASLQRLVQHLDAVGPSVKRISALAPTYDFSPSHKANGYHSLLTVFRKCCLRIFDILCYITLYRDSWLFNMSDSQKDLENFVTCLGQLRACFHYLERLSAFCTPKNLFPDEESLSEDEYASAITVMYDFETLNPECFYGRCLAFQYCKSMCTPLTVIHQALTCHSEMFAKSNYLSKAVSGLIGVGKYFRVAEKRAKKFVTVTRECGVDFCKSFWSLSDNPALVQLSLFACPGVALDSIINIPLKEFELLTEDGEMKLIEPVCPEDFRNFNVECSIKKDHVDARILSSKLRSGQEVHLSKMGVLTNLLKKQHEQSPYLIIHLHGGGFVGQSSASHEIYLRSWAVKSDVPIFSIDYSHAPKYTAPFQVEETFFAYCWALKNCSLLGSTAKRVVVVGDSAGGNLAVCVSLMAASRGVRVPDGVYPIYGGMLVQYKPGPSRMLALIDPLVPLGLISLCLQAYVGTVNEESSTGDINENEMIEDEPIEEVLPPVTMPNSDSRHEESTRESSENEMVDDDPMEDVLPLASIPSDASNISSSPSFSAKLSKSSRIHPLLKNMKTVHHHRNDSGFFDTNSTTSDISPSDDVVPCETLLTSLKGKQTRHAEKSNVTASPDKSVLFGNEDSNVPDDVSDTSSLAGCCSLTSDGNSNGAFSCNDVVASYAQLKTFKVSPMKRALKNNPGDSPFISPIYAPDSLLKKLNRVIISACHMDPLLDDSVSFACRLRDLGVPVDLDLIPDLPHGFLSFVTFSAEANEASMNCVKNIMHILEGTSCS